MHIWLIKGGEPLPIDGDVRLFRTGMLARWLNDAGHSVVWWSSTFNHAEKAVRSNSDAEFSLAKGYTLRLVRESPYKRNVSIQRLVSHQMFARRLLNQANSDAVRPDVVVCALPTPQAAAAAAQYCVERSVPLVLDIRDLWPDLIMDSAPVAFRWLARIATAAMRRNVRYAARVAHSIWGVTPAYVEWGVHYADRSLGAFDISFPMAYNETPPSSRELCQARTFWSDSGIGDDFEGLRCCFFGAFGAQFDIETVLAAARILVSDDIPVQFVLCGAGDNLDRYRTISTGLPNVVFPGWVDRGRIWQLMRSSDVGIAPYRNTTNFKLNLPNKPAEYFSAGLPVVSPLEGYLGELLAERGCGLKYREGDPAHLASILRQLRDRPEIRSKLSNSARQVFQEQFSADRIGAAMVHQIERVAADYRERAP